MRFFPLSSLPLLLILTSIVVSRAFPFDDDNPPLQQRRVHRSANISTSHGNDNDLSDDELAKNLKARESEATNLNKEIETLNGKLKKKEEEALAPFKDFEEKLKKYEELKNKTKDYEDLKEGAKIADNAVTNAHEALRQINATLKSQEEEEIKCNNLEKEVNDLKNNTEILKEAEAKNETLTNEVKDQQALVGLLTQDKVKKEKAVADAKEKAESYKTSFEGNNCKSFDECPDIVTGWTEANNTLEDAQKKVNTMNEATNKLKQLQNDINQVLKNLKHYVEVESDPSSFINFKQSRLNSCKLNLKNLNPPIATTREQQIAAIELLDLAIANKTICDTKLEQNPASDADIRAKRMAYANFLSAQKIRDPLHKEIEEMKKNLKDLEKQLAEANARVGQLKKVQSGRRKQEEPSQSSILPWLLPLIIVLVIVGLAVGGYVYWKKRKTGPRRPEDPIEKEPAAGSDNGASTSKSQTPLTPQPSPVVVESPKPPVAVAPPKALETVPPPELPVAVPPPKADSEQEPDYENIEFLDKNECKKYEDVKLVENDHVRGKIMKANGGKGTTVWRCPVRHKKIYAYSFNMDNKDGKFQMILGDCEPILRFDARQFNNAFMDYMKSFLYVDLPGKKQLVKRLPMRITNPNGDGKSFHSIKDDIQIFVKGIHRKTLKQCHEDKEERKAIQAKIPEIMKTKGKDIIHKEGNYVTIKYKQYEDIDILFQSNKECPDTERLWKKDGKERADLTLERIDQLIKLVFDAFFLDPKGFAWDKDEMLSIWYTAQKLFEQDKKLLKVNGDTVVIISDIHGSLDTLKYIMASCGDIGSDEWKKRKFVFTGDYVDRGSDSLDVIMIVFMLRIRYPDNIFLLRGNHETYHINVAYGTAAEMKMKFGDKEGTDLHFLLNIVFSFMSVACVVHDVVFCMHGFIPRPVSAAKLEELDDLNDQAKVPKFMFDVWTKEFVLDLLWADPNCGPVSHKGPRGQLIAEPDSKKFMKKMNVEMIGRGHQWVPNGFEHFTDPRVISLFADPNADLDQGPSRGAFMILDRSMAHCFVILDHQDVPDKLTAPEAFNIIKKGTQAFNKGEHGTGLRGRGVEGDGDASETERNSESKHSKSRH